MERAGSRGRCFPLVAPEFAGAPDKPTAVFHLARTAFVAETLTSIAHKPMAVLSVPVEDIFNTGQVAERRVLFRLTALCDFSRAFADRDTGRVGKEVQGH